MRPLISFMHISLDGFVAGPGGTMDWITHDEEISDFIGRRAHQTSTSLYGRKTFDLMEGYWPTAAEKPGATGFTVRHAAWYRQVRKLVVSNTLGSSSKADVHVVQGDLRAALQPIKEEGTGEILIFGSPSTTRALMEQNLVDGFWLFVNPVVLGSGIPLFSGILNRMLLNAGPMHRFKSGVTEMNFTLKKS